MLKIGHKIAKVRWSARWGDLHCKLGDLNIASNEDGEDLVDAAAPDWHQHDEPH